MLLHELLDSLPEHLRERTRVQNEGTVGELLQSRGFILYWMRTAVRVDENPALDVAKLIAHRQNVPLLVYQAISEHDSFASDRHHTFVLQGARDAQKRFIESEVSYAFHLATSDDRRPHLRELASGAAVVVTEDMPVDPPRRFLTALSKTCQAPIVTVDTTCVAPMSLVRPRTEGSCGALGSSTDRFSPNKVSSVRLGLGQLPATPVDLTLISIQQKQPFHGSIPFAWRSSGQVSRACLQRGRCKTMASM